MSVPSAAPIRPNRVRPREPIPQREKALSGRRSPLIRAGNGARLASSGWTRPVRDRAGAAVGSRPREAPPRHPEAEGCDENVLAPGRTAAALPRAGRRGGGGDRVRDPEPGGAPAPAAPGADDAGAGRDRAGPGRGAEGPRLRQRAAGTGLGGGGRGERRRHLPPPGAREGGDPAGRNRAPPDRPHRLPARRRADRGERPLDRSPARGARRAGVEHEALARHRGAKHRPRPQGARTQAAARPSGHRLPRPRWTRRSGRCSSGSRRSRTCATR